MASTKISALTDGAPIQATDLFVIARAGGNFKVAANALFASPPAIGSTTPAGGAFTSLSATGNITSTGNQIAITPVTQSQTGFFKVNNTGGGYYFGAEQSGGGAIIVGSASYALAISADQAVPIQFGISNTLYSTIGTAGAMRWNAYGAGAITSDASGNLTAASDRTHKRNPRPFTKGLAEILQLISYTYGYTLESGLDQTRDDYVGFMAQDVEPIFPEAVGKMQDQVEPAFLPKGLIETAERLVNPAAGEVVKEGALTLNPFVILAAVPNALREMQAQIDALTARLAAAGIK